MCEGELWGEGTLECRLRSGLGEGSCSAALRPWCPGEGIQPKGQGFPGISSSVCMAGGGAYEPTCAGPRHPDVPPNPVP